MSRMHISKGTSFKCPLYTVSINRSVQLNSTHPGLDCNHKFQVFVYCISLSPVFWDFCCEASVNQWPQRAFSTSYLSIWSFSTQLIPAPSLFSSFLSNSSSYFDYNDYPHRLNETLSSLTELRSLIRDGSRCQTRSANWLVEKAEITDCEVLPVKLNLSHSQLCHFLSTFATVLALESTDSRAFVDCLCSQGIFCWRTYNWTEKYVTNLTNRNMYGIRQMQ